MGLLNGLLSKRAAPRWDVVTWPWGGWNYPPPIISEWDEAYQYPPDDPYLHNLIYMASHGWHYYQKAMVEMSLIHPLALYKPVIHKEFRETFDARYEHNGMPLLLYEKDRTLVMSHDWEAYWLYREREDAAVPCILLGHFSAVPGIAVCDRPFMVERPDVAASRCEPLCTW